MALFKKKNIQTLPSEQKNKSENLDSVIDNLSVEMRVMPQKFLGAKPGKALKDTVSRGSASSIPSSHESDTSIAKPSSQKSVKKNIIRGVIIIIVVGVLLAVGALFFVRSLKKQELNQQQSEIQAEVTFQESVTQEELTSSPIYNTSTSTGEKSLSLTQDLTNDVSTSTIIIPQEPEFARSLADPQELDKDSDLLSIEEEKLFGTRVENFDTDGDGYLDGQEVLNLYDPRFGSSALLSDSSSVRTFISQVYNYRLLVPNSWKESSNVLSPSVQRFTSDSIVSQDGLGEYIEVAVEDNQNQFATIEEWYKAQFPNIPFNTVAAVRGSGIQGIISPDGLQAYFLTGQYITTIAYTPSVDGNAYFRTVFMMIVRSFASFKNPLSN